MEVTETARIVRAEAPRRAMGRSLARSRATSYDDKDVQKRPEHFDQVWSRAARSGLFALLLVPLSACSVAAEAETLAEERLVVHALVQVRRTETLEGDARADALAGLIRVPDTADAAEVFALAGLRDQVPPVGQCQTGDSNRSADAGMSSVELVPADAVLMLTPGGEHVLAPHAFPSISDSIRGVIYTSRDQTASLLPSGGKYEIILRGAVGLENERAVHESPTVPTGVTVGGVPLGNVDEITQTDLDFTWNPSGSTLDLLATRLRWNDSTYTCTFRDADGFGSLSLVDVRKAVPGFALGDDAPITLSLHRVRAEASASPGETSVVEVRFDFSVARELGVALSGDVPSGDAPRGGAPAGGE